MNAHDVVMMVERLGVSFMILLTLLYVLGKSLNWFAEKVVLPISSKHIEFIDRLEKGIGKVVETQVDIRNDLKKVLDNTRTIKTNVDFPAKIP